jgi:hypothetical protein
MVLEMAKPDFDEKLMVDGDHAGVLRCGVRIPQSGVSLQTLT